MSVIYPYFLMISRWLIAAVSVWLVFGWVRYYRGHKTALPVYAALTTSDGVSIPVTAKENLIGRQKSDDIFIPLQGVQKKHALLYTEKERWFLAPLNGKVQINLQNATTSAPLSYGDKITLAGQTLTFRRRESEDIFSKRPPSAFPLLFLLSFFQLLVGLSISLRDWESLDPVIPMSFMLLIVLEWSYYIIGRWVTHFTLLAELPVFYLFTLGVAVGCCTLPAEMGKQMLCFGLGFIGFLLFSWLLKYREFFEKIQPVLMVGSLCLLYYTALFGAKINNSRNWLRLGGLSLQPSELVKVVFVLCGAATLTTLIRNKKKRFFFLVYAVLCLGALALMLDFGAVAIFFVGMMILLTLRNEHPLLLGGIVGAAVVGGAGVIALYPYIARRFSAWLHAWEFANGAGYQQSRTMMSFASGGLLGVGGGNGYLHEIPAAENDLVFGIIGEEWGGIVALTAALCLVAIGLYAYRLMKQTDSLFYTIAVSGAAVMLIFQSALNIFGSVDLLPLTGVTFVFVSRGGTSLMAAWWMISFLKAAELHHKSPLEWRDEG